MLRAVPANKHAIVHALKSNSKLSIIPGGVAEMFLENTHDTEVIKLKGRQGFIKLALQTGTPIVPIYAFGVSQAMRLVPGSQFLAKLSRVLRVRLCKFAAIVIFFPVFLDVNSLVLWKVGTANSKTNPTASCCWKSNSCASSQESQPRPCQPLAPASSHSC